MLFYVITLLYIAVAARATEYTSSGDNCSHQPPIGTVSKDSYYGSVDASCPRPLKPWRSLKAPCKPKVNLLMPKAEGTWYKASPHIGLRAQGCYRKSRCMYSDPIGMNFEHDLQTAEGLYNWEPKECALPRLTAEMARQCLSHKSLSFVGDSVTRYQYVSLAHWLSKAAQLDPFADNVTIPSLAHEYQWPDWPTFWRGLVQALSCATDAEAQATCHGHRNSVSKPGERQKVWSAICVRLSTLWLHRWGMHLTSALPAPSCRQSPSLKYLSGMSSGSTSSRSHQTPQFPHGYSQTWR